MDYFSFVDVMEENDLRLFCRQSYIYNISLQEERKKYEKILIVLYDKWLEGDMTEKDWEPLSSLFKYFVKVDLEAK